MRAPAETGWIYYQVFAVQCDNSKSHGVLEDCDSLIAQVEEALDKVKTAIKTLKEFKACFQVKCHTVRK